MKIGYNIKLLRRLYDDFKYYWYRSIKNYTINNFVAERRTLFMIYKI